MNQASIIWVPGTIAYFSMDVAIDSDIPTYSGGLGILAGDMPGRQRI
jgi:glucan phosphorylase